ncbi:hypothetical protein [Cellulomonas sp. URHD0024]|uniref:hypothetical protein n=1 Tax=Cellulomonas sp. URHD0024 TaxID=1302620 RepID=UPI0004221AC7|nr:hypothetical protein [Cellulomonas sp. URHD0024]
MGVEQAVGGDPTALRALAGSLRRDADVLADRVARVAGRVDLMVYAGPAAVAFRQRIADARQQAFEAQSRMQALAAWCEQRAALVEAGVL